MSNSGGDGGGCCRCCFSFILTSCLTALFIWLSLRTSNPVCSIQDFYLPALNTSSNFTSNHTIYLDLKLDNENKDKGIHYDPLNITLYYMNGTNESRPNPIVNYTLPGFYQGHNKHTRRRNLSETYAQPWEAAIRAVGNGSTVVFRVDLVTAVRFKIMAWNTKRHKLVVGANVVIDNSGKKGKKAIRLKSSAPDIFHHRQPVGGSMVVFSTLVLVFI